MNMIIYLAQVTGCTAVFYLFYYAFLRKLTFFSINRWYLLSTVILSFLIPLIKIDINEPKPYTGVVEQVVYNYAPQPAEPTVFTLTVDEATISKPVKWQDVLRYTYYIAVAALSVHLLITLLAFFKRLKGKQISKLGNVNILSGNNKVSNGSFLNYIFVNEGELSADEIRQIIAHEMMHVKLYHSADRIIVKLAQIILWFNPFIYLYARSVEENHEFEVDHAVANDTDKQNYANLLLHLSVAGNGILYHNFSKVPLKKRITMLFIKPTTNMKKVIYLLFVPVVLISSLAFASLKKSEKAHNVIDRPQKLKKLELPKVIEDFKKTDYYKRSHAFVDKTIKVKVTDLEFNDGKLDLLKVKYEGYPYQILHFNLPQMPDLKVGDELSIKVQTFIIDFEPKAKGLMEMKISEPLQLKPESIYKGGEMLYSAGKDFKDAAQEPVIDTNKYRQKLSPAGEAAREKEDAYRKSDDFKIKKKSIDEFHKAGEVTVKIKANATDNRGNKGLTFDHAGQEYFIATGRAQQKQLANILKVGDVLKLKSFGETIGKEFKYIEIWPSYIIKDDKKVFELAEAGKIPAYPFLYEANKVRFTDGQLTKITKYANGKWKTAVVETVNGYRFNINFKPDGPDMNSLSDDDHVRLRFVGEKKTGAKTYQVNWVAISDDIKSHGIQEPTLFPKFYVKADNKAAAAKRPLTMKDIYVLKAGSSVKKDKDHIQLYGGVDLKIGEMTITAEHVTIDNKKKLITARGSKDADDSKRIFATLRGKGDTTTIISDSLAFNYQKMGAHVWNSRQGSNNKN
ncbi:M56 family metallopeptidase [Mucilaginibacter myungsuensis]|uniref:M56 family metallopeptidase n=1 Tax=Mucilaginibacter myungsuensis TaxID=649104 RepID=A0A929KZE4_9SPHI|nr:M56 family metallopeptidase [Mucilaginibacter myungsuensis]MBE9660466.1 M56 family metallopeptidase [Mucilaginibacter myungsuensis]MDN3600508.1 M56 family metallopeptidase [Mucilaginibacter myungsuensis]